MDPDERYAYLHIYIGNRHSDKTKTLKKNYLENGNEKRRTINGIKISGFRVITVKILCFSVLSLYFTGH